MNLLAKQKLHLNTAVLGILAAMSVLVVSPAPVVQAGVPDLADPAEVTTFFDELLPGQLDEYHIAGTAVAVVKDGQLIFAKGYGFANLEASQPVIADQTLFRTDSTGKLFIWTAVMQLVEQGKLDLNANVNGYLDFSIPVTFAKPITLRHLLSHSAGFEDMGYMFAHDESNVISSF